MEWLLVQGADPRAVDTSGLTALHYAVHAGVECVEVMEWLLMQGVDPRAVDTSGLTALHYAIHVRDVKAVQWLAEHGDMHAVDISGSIALHLAASNGDLASIKWLVEHGSDVSLRNAAGNTPLDEARLLPDNVEAVAWLQKHESSESALLALLAEEEGEAAVQAGGAGAGSGKKTKNRKKDAYKKKAQQAQEAAEGESALLSSLEDEGKEESGTASGTMKNKKNMIRKQKAQQVQEEDEAEGRSAEKKREGMRQKPEEKGKGGAAKETQEKSGMEREGGEAQLEMGSLPVTLLAAEELQREIAQLKAENARLGADNHGLRESNDSLNASLYGANIEIQRLGAEVQSLTAEHTDALRRNAGLVENVAHLPAVNALERKEAKEIVSSTVNFDDAAADNPPPRVFLRQDSRRQHRDTSCVEWGIGLVWSTAADFRGMAHWIFLAADGAVGRIGRHRVLLCAVPTRRVRVSDHTRSQHALFVNTSKPHRSQHLEVDQQPRDRG
jgi:hypothetical protein